MSFDDATGTAKVSNGNGNLSFFVNNNNESGVASSEFGVIWGFDGSATLTKGSVPVARLTGLSDSTGNSTKLVMHQKAVTDALDNVKTTIEQTTGNSDTSVMSQKATTAAINSAKTDVVQTSGASTTSVMSQDAVTKAIYTASSVGFSQAWVDMTALRSPNINYTNSTGRPIVIAMNVKNVPGGLFASSIVVNAFEISTGSNVSGEHRFISAIVPPGGVYMYKPLTESGVTLLELR